jgi:hypothetical protein
MKAIIKELSDPTLEGLYEIGQEIQVEKPSIGNHYYDSDRGYSFLDSDLEIIEDLKDDHYNNDKGSLYLFAEQHGLNAWEFDCIKRIVRCRKKGQFISDLEKTKRVIDLYIKEHEEGKNN